MTSMTITFFFQKEKSLHSFTRLCYFSTTPACPPPLKSRARMSPHDSPKFTWYHISQCISTAKEQPTASPKSHFLTMPSKLPPSTQGQTVPAGTARDLGRFLQAPQKDPGRMASPQPAGKSAKACAGTGNKRQGRSLFHIHNCQWFYRALRSRRTVVIFILLGPAGPSSQGSHKKMVYCSSAGLMVYTTFCIHSKLNLAAPDSDMSSSSRISTSA